MSTTAVSVDSSDCSEDQQDLDVDIQRDAKAWSKFSGMKYTQALRLMKHPLAQGILGERISARKLIAVLTEHPVLAEYDEDTDEVYTILGEFGLRRDEDHPLETGTDAYLTLIKCVEFLRMFDVMSEAEIASADRGDDYSVRMSGSYSLKHTAETYLGRYVSNGVLIWAAAALDVPMRGQEGIDNPNAALYLNRHQVDYIDASLRRVGAGEMPGAHHYRPAGYRYLTGALKQFDETEEVPGRWNGVDEHAEPLTSLFHEWLVAQVDPSGDRGDFGSRENLAYDYRAGVRDSEHGVAMQPEDLVRILVDRHADPEFVDGAREAVLDWARTSPDSHGIRTELIDEERSSHQGWGAGSGTIERFEYRCPCGNGTIVEDHDNIPGFREHSLTIMCPKCDKEWRQVSGSPAYRWRIEPIERAAS